MSTLAARSQSLVGQYRGERLASRVIGDLERGSGIVLGRNRRRGQVSTRLHEKEVSDLAAGRDALDAASIDEPIDL